MGHVDDEGTDVGADSDYVLQNRTAWNEFSKWYFDPGRRHWSEEGISWGVWSVPESELQLLPDVEGLDIIELGCGTAYISAWLARRGGRVVGIDNSPAQLESARQFQQEFGLDFPLLFGNAESVPYADGSFDIAVSEYGAAIWCDPYKWIPEASRLLRPGGKLVFLGNAALFMLCVPDDENEPPDNVIKRDYFGMHRMEWPDDPIPAVEFHLPHGELIDLLRSSGFEIERLVEIRPPLGSTQSHIAVTLDWARRWPCEEAWVVRKAQ